MSEPEIQTMCEIPIGIDAPTDRAWGEQTRQPPHNFDIGDDRMRRAVYHAYGYVKNACAL
jgi:fumarate hydratase class II